MADKLHLALEGYYIPGKHEMEAHFCVLSGQRCNGNLLRKFHTTDRWILV